MHCSWAYKMMALPPFELEHEVFGWTHAEAAKRMAQHWSLPEGVGRGGRCDWKSINGRLNVFIRPNWRWRCWPAAERSRSALVGVQRAGGLLPAGGSCRRPRTHNATGADRRRIPQTGAPLESRQFPHVLGGALSEGDSTRVMKGEKLWLNSISGQFRSVRCDMGCEPDAKPMHRNLRC